MELTFAEQSLAFLFSIILGVFLGVIYGVFKFVRVAFNLKKAAVFLADFLFMIICAFSLFFLSLGYIDGFARFYTFFGATLGLLIYRLTLGRLFCLLYTPVVGFFKKVFRKILSLIKINIKKLLKFAHKILYNVIGGKGRANNPQFEKKE